MEGPAFGPKARFKTRRAITIIASPIFCAVQIAAAAPRVRVLNLQQVKVFFPIGAFFKKRRRTITNFDPLHGAVIKLPCFGHIPEIFVAGDRSSTERPFLNGLAERLCSTGFDFGGDKVSHASNCTKLVTAECIPLPLGPSGRGS